MRFLQSLILIVLAGFVNNMYSSPYSSQIAYQGILTDGSGNALKDTLYNVDFCLYTDSTGGIPIWTEQKKISTKGGVFSHMLGSVVSLEALKFDMQYWLGVKRGGDEIGKRIQLGIVPYARRAMVADSSVKASVSDSTKKINGRNIDPVSIDSSKIMLQSITGKQIKNGTISAANIDTSFKASKALIADTAMFIRSTSALDVTSGKFSNSISYGSNGLLKNGTITIPYNDSTEHLLFTMGDLGGSLWKVTLGFNNMFNSYYQEFLLRACDFGGCSFLWYVTPIGSRIEGPQGWGSAKLVFDWTLSTSNVNANCTTGDWNTNQLLVKLTNRSGAPISGYSTNAVINYTVQRLQ